MSILEKWAETIDYSMGFHLGGLWGNMLAESPHFAETPREMSFIFFEIIEALIEKGDLLIDLRVDAENLPWRKPQIEVLNWLKSTLPLETINGESRSWWIDNSDRPDGTYPGACIWRCEGYNGADVTWA
jgi:hypothetical protein